MDERAKALTESDDWIFPPWPERTRRPPGYEVVEFALPEAYVEHREKIALTIEEHFGGSAAVTEAVEDALRHFQAERAMDIDWACEIRDKPGRARQGKKLEKLAQALKEARHQLEEVGEDGRTRVVTLGDAFRLSKADLMTLEDLLPRASTAAKIAAWLLAGDEQPRRGPRPEVARRRLVYRLKLVWEAFTDEPITEQRPRFGGAGPWPFRDFVEAILEPITGKGGEWFIRELVYPRPEE